MDTMFLIIMNGIIITINLIVGLVQRNEQLIVQILKLVIVGQNFWDFLFDDIEIKAHLL